MKTEDKNIPGFWIRFLASWFDFLIICIVLKVLYTIILILQLNIYLSAEFTFLVLLMTYSTIAISLKGQTVGKWLLNLKVVNNRNFGRLSVTF